MEYLILVLIVIIFYLRFSFWQEDKNNDEHLEKIKKMLEDVEVELSLIHISEPTRPY